MITIVIMKKGRPIAKNNRLLIIPKIRAVICSKIIVIPTSKSGVILVSICSIFLYRSRALFLFDISKVFYTFESKKELITFFTILYPDNFKYKVKKIILIMLKVMNKRTDIPNLRVTKCFYSATSEPTKDE